jgi:hypothetical protein
MEKSPPANEMATIVVKSTTPMERAIRLSLPVRLKKGQSTIRERERVDSLLRVEASGFDLFQCLPLGLRHKEVHKDGPDDTDSTISQESA